MGRFMPTLFSWKNAFSDGNTNNNEAISGENDNSNQT